MTKGVAHAVTVDGISYPSKGAAACALHKLGGRTATQIAELIGSTRGAVEQAIKKERRKATNAEPATAKNQWTPEKRDKARKLFGQTMIYIAEALQVPAREFLTYVLHGVIPPSQEIQNPADIRWTDGASPPAPDLVAIEHYQSPPRSAFEPAEGDVVDADHLIEEPGRDDDEAELAALTWVDDPEATFNVLLLTDADVTRELVDSWTPEQRRQAEDWAGALHLSASDNDDIVVPTRPDFVQLRSFTGINPITGGKLESATIVQEPPAHPASRFPDAPPAAPAGPSPRLIPPGGIFPGLHEVRLVRQDGKYLHESLDGWTDKAKYAWQGGRQLYDTVKARMPKIVGKLSMEVVA